MNDDVRASFNKNYNEGLDSWKNPSGWKIVASFGLTSLAAIGAFVVGRRTAASVAYVYHAFKK